MEGGTVGVRGGLVIEKKKSAHFSLSVLIFTIDIFLRKVLSQDCSISFGRYASTTVNGECPFPTSIRKGMTDLGVGNDTIIFGHDKVINISNHRGPILDKFLFHGMPDWPASCNIH